MLHSSPGAALVSDWGGDWADFRAANVTGLRLLLEAAAADSDKSLGRAYNASDGSDITWRQYVTRLAQIAGRPRRAPSSRAGSHEIQAVRL